MNQEKLDTELWVDAGPTGVAGFLVQVDPISNDRLLIACMSYSFNEIEMKYPQVEKECLSALLACEHFYLHLIGQYFTLYTDNQAIALILSPNTIQQKKSPIRLNHWRGRLTQYARMTPQFIGGEKNIADFLSRCLKHRVLVPHTHSLDAEIAVNTIISEKIQNINQINVQTISTGEDQTMVTLEEIIDATKADETLQAIKSHIEAGHSFLPKKDTRFNGYRQTFANISVAQNGIMLNNDLIIIPQALGERIVKLAHICHVGLNSSLRFLQNNYHIINISDLVKNTIDSQANFPQISNFLSTHMPTSFSQVLFKE